MGVAMNFELELGGVVSDSPLSSSSSYTANQKRLYVLLEGCWAAVDYVLSTYRAERCVLLTVT